MREIDMEVNIELGPEFKRQFTMKYIIDMLVMCMQTSIMGKQIVDVPNLWKGYCYWRNTIFNFKGIASVKQYLTFYLYNAWYYLMIRRSWKWFRCFNEAYFAGFKSLPDDGYRQYMNN